MFTEEQNELIESAAEMLYGLIHVRYIITSKGLSAMVNSLKFFLMDILLFFFNLWYFHIYCLRSWISTRTLISVDALEWIAAANHVFLLGNRMFLVRVRWRFTALDVKTSTIQDPNI